MDGGIWGCRSPQHQSGARIVPGQQGSTLGEGGKRADEGTPTTRCEVSRPPCELGGAGPSTVESVRLDPELNVQIAARAERYGVTTSDVIREALRRYLHAG